MGDNNNSPHHHPAHSQHPQHAPPQQVVDHTPPTTNANGQYYQPAPEQAHYSYTHHSPVEAIPVTPQQAHHHYQQHATVNPGSAVSGSFPASHFSPASPYTSGPAMSYPDSSGVYHRPVWPQSYNSHMYSPRQSQQYSFVSIPGSVQHKRPRRRYEEIERMYKCGYNGCEKAYGTLNHLNAHVTMQGHGQKRTPDEFKEIRKQWRERKRQLERETRDREQQQQQAASNAAVADSPEDPHSRMQFRGARPVLPPPNQQSLPNQFPPTPTTASIPPPIEYQQQGSMYDGYPPHGQSNYTYGQR